MAKEKRQQKPIDDLREAQCKTWARNPEIIQCLKSIINWAEEANSSATKVDENVHDWVNNIVWYSNMQDIDPVFGRARPYVKRK